MLGVVLSQKLWENGIDSHNKYGHEEGFWELRAHEPHKRTMKMWKFLAKKNRIPRRHAHLPGVAPHDSLLFLQKITARNCGKHPECYCGLFEN
jgi:hypothetical protein